MVDTCSQGRLANSWSFAFVYAFLASFRVVLGIEALEPEELESMIDTTSCYNPTMNSLMFSLVGHSLNRKNPITAERWQRSCNELMTKMPHFADIEIPTETAQSLENFMQLESSTKISVIKWLCECILESSDNLRNAMEVQINMSKKDKDSGKAQPQLIRLEPFAIDDKKRQYWMLGNNSRFLYRESKPNSKNTVWELTAADINQFQSLSEELRKSRKRVNKDIASIIDTEVVPHLERDIKRREQKEKAMRRNMALFSNVEIRETRTRKRKQVNYNFEDYDLGIEDEYVH